MDLGSDRNRGRSSGNTRRDDYRRDETSGCDSSGCLIVSFAVIREVTKGLILLRLARNVDRMGLTENVHGS